MPGVLDGRVVLISGGARGQGAAHGRRLAEEGAAVFLGDVLDDVGAAEAERLRADDLDVTYLHLDVTSEDDWIAAVQQAESTRGGLHVVVNNAGIVHVAFPEEETVEAFNKTLDVNVIGVFLGMKIGAAALRRAGGGSIINIASINGMTGAPAHIAYNASKGAVRMMTKCAAIAFADDRIRVNTICPGWVVTQQSAEEVEHMRAKGIPSTVGPRTLVKDGDMPRGAQPREISEGVLFLASDASSFVNGTDLSIDGGFGAW